MNVTICNQDVILNSDIIILAVKPYQILDVMKEIHDTYTAVQQHAGKATSSPRSFRPLIVSVAASVTLADIEEKVNQTHSAMYKHLQEPLYEDTPEIIYSNNSLNKYAGIGPSYVEKST